MKPHEVRVAAGAAEPQTIGGIQSFDLTTDMLEMADPFSLSMPFHILLWEAFKTDNEVQLYIDDTAMLSGFVDRREYSCEKSAGAKIEASGRDRGGRMLDDAAPFGSHVGKGVLDLAKVMAGEWFEKVSSSNATNRRLIRGRGKALAGVSKEPAITKGSDISKKVEPGETRAQVLQEFLEKAGLLAWSSADGREFIVGKPNYAQAPQYRFFQAAEGSARADETNVVSVTYAEDIGDAYSEYAVYGASKGNGASYGKNVTRRKARSLDGFKEGGTGLLFSHPKRMAISDGDIKSGKEALERAIREDDLRRASIFEHTVTVADWGQPYQGRGESVIYAFDKIAVFEIEDLNLRQECLITKVQFTESKGGGQLATVYMVPVGTKLVFS